MNIVQLGKQIVSKQEKSFVMEVTSCPRKVDFLYKDLWSKWKNKKTIISTLNLCNVWHC